MQFLVHHRGVTTVAWLGVLFFAVSTGYALANPNAFGPHNLADYTAIVILLAGALLWLLDRVIGAPRPRTALAEQPGEHSGNAQSNLAR